MLSGMLDITSLCMSPAFLLDNNDIFVSCTLSLPAPGVLSLLTPGSLLCAARLFVLLLVGAATVTPVLSPGPKQLSPLAVLFHPQVLAALVLPLLTS